MAKLVWSGSPGGEVEYLVNPTRTVIGRSPGLDIVLQHDSISRQHAQIDRYGDRFYLTDLGSTNGSFHKGLRIKRAALSEGDALTLGELPFVFSHEDPRGTGARFQPLRGLSRILEQLSEPSPAVIAPSDPPEGAFGGMLDELRRKSERWEAAYRQLTVLYRIANVLQAPEDLDAKLATAIKLAIATLKAERGFLFEYNQEGDELERRVAFARTSEGATMIDWVRAVARRAVDVEEALASGPDLSLGTAMTRPPSGRVFVVAPLRTQRGCYGALYFDAVSKEVAWGKEEVEFVSTLAGQMGATLDHEHYARQMIRKSQVEKELAIAREVQARLLPETLEGAEGVRVQGRSRPSRDVGGDYFDSIPGADGALRTVVADVSGKGVPAALVQSQVRAHLRSALRQGVALDRAVGDLNRALLDDYGGRMYVTAFLTSIEPGAGVLRFVNAGHVWPILLPGDGAAARLLEEGSRPCGLFPDSTFEIHELRLGPGDRLLVASDGIEDAENTQGERFGVERYRALVEAHRGVGVGELVDAIFAELDRFGEDAPQFDDATLLVLEATG